jgi:hypothetical protein
MLREVIMVSQIPGQPFRRWFTDRKHDLYVWYDDRHKEIIGFQFCYEVDRKEHALTFLNDKGWRHTSVDDGETRKSKKGTTILGPAHMTPIMAAYAGYDVQELAERFKEISADIGGDISSHIYELISSSAAAK